ncbi:MAG: alpha-mannosidase [Clostridia bacterium]|nr:alpha-mannosidase [Clostridia bacterium]
MTYLQKLKTLDGYRANGKHAERICSELSYLDAISKNEDGKYDALIEEAADILLSHIDVDGVITAKAAAEAEGRLMTLQPEAKKYTELFISHAHIDMNWMWGYNETAAITVDTFRTVLDLMKQFPDMTFGQSQASTYEIIDKYCPELLSEIKERIKEGRWEVTAAEWVEPDKNMPDGESLTRQILQSRKYLSGLFDIPAGSFDIDFVPDTFGHNINVPEILSDAGIKYMYHCRGHEGPCVYYYASPSGKKVLNYREYAWYNGEISPFKFEILPQFCKNEKINTYLCVFGVGDHGGGPSRRDIERIKEYQSWPLAPVIRFGTFREYFTLLENSGIDFPVYDTERNFLFTGCYTTQTRIKAANRIAEIRLNETEALAAEAAVSAGAPLQPDRLDRAWRNVLFNHFHDILPGSGTVETREFAMGRFQEAMADINVYGNLCMRRISEATDTSPIPFVKGFETTSEGGGAGYLQSQGLGYRYTAAERGNGPVRAFQIFNTTAKERDEFTELTVWDYAEGFADAMMTDADGAEIPFSVLEQGRGYWGHSYSTLLVRAAVPAFGYTTVILKQREKDGHKHIVPHVYEYTDAHINDAPFVLENEYIRAVFEKKSCRLTSLTDKESGEELIKEPSCYFRYAEENAVYGMTSWRVGPYMTETDLNEKYGARYFALSGDGNYSRINYEMKFGASNLTCAITLKKGSRMLEFSAHVDWNEAAERGRKIPQISFAVPVSYDNGGTFSSDVPFGIIKRKELAHDIPALSYVCADRDGGSVALMTDTKYGYRFSGGALSVTLIRSAYDPDPYPERGIHDIRIGVAVCRPEDVKDVSAALCRPMPFISATKHGGTLPLSASALEVKGSVRVSCVKPSEDGSGVTVRVYDTTGADQTVSLRFAKDVSSAYICQSDEKEERQADVKDGAAVLEVPAYSAVTAKVRF